MISVKEFKDALKWGYSAFPFYTSAYFLVADKPKRKYFVKWNYLSLFKDGQLLGYNSNSINSMGEIAIKELLSGNERYYKELLFVLNEIHVATDRCLRVEKEGKIRNLNYWWKPGQKAYSHGAGLIFAFDNALNIFFASIEKSDPDLYKRLMSNIVEDKESFLTKAIKDLQSWVKESPRDFSRVYRRFYKKYGWLQNSYLGSFDMTEEWLKNYYLESKKKGASIKSSKPLPIDPKYNSLIKTAKLAIAFRDDRKKMFLMLVGIMDKWLHLICQENSWDYDEMKWLSMEEVLACLKGDKKMLTKAKLYARNGERVGIMTVTGYNEVGLDFFKKVESLNSPQNNAVEIRGSIGNKGKIKGIAKLIWDVNLDGNKLNKGDVLVTSMTRPEFLQLMIRAAAFVTDEGGITCHAGIVAREMNKPCIVGTKVATKILRDGDLVEVDANNGVVKILKNSK